MLRNNFHLLSCDYRRLSSGRSVYVNSRLSLNRFCDLCRLVRTSGLVESCRFLVVICDNVADVFTFLNKVFMRLHQAAALLLHWRKPVSTNGVRILPDILKDINGHKRDTNHMEPDVVLHAPERRSIPRARRENSEHRPETHSRDDQDTQSRKCHSYRCSQHRQSNRHRDHHYSCPSTDSDSAVLTRHNPDIDIAVFTRHNVDGDNDVLTHHNTDNENAVLTRHNTDNDILTRRNTDNDVITRHNTDNGVLTRHNTDSAVFARHKNNSNIPRYAGSLNSDHRYKRSNRGDIEAQRIDSIQFADLRNISSHTARLRGPMMKLQQFDSPNNSQICHENRREILNQDTVLASSVMNNSHVGGGTEGDAGGAEKSRSDVTECYRVVQSGPQVQDVDREISKDIVLALRAIGDDLDVRMRECNEFSPKAMLNGLTMNARGLLLPSLNKHDILAVVFDVSVLLLKLIQL